MTLVRYTPRERRLFSVPFFDDFFHRFGSGLPTTWRDESWTPKADVKEKNDHFLVEAELPGVDRKDIKIEVKNDVLTISGERKVEKAEEEDGYERRERYYGSFERSFILPEHVKGEEISAEYKNGILSLKIPKTEEVKPREIEIKVK